MPLCRSQHRRRTRLRRLVASALLLGTAAMPGWAATDLVVEVAGIQAPLGQIGCSLFAQDTGLPMDNSRAQQLWVPAMVDSATCRFGGLQPGRYAVSVGHDLNGNRRVDINFLGMPTEQWGVSNNALPTLRAPRYDEAVFLVKADTAKQVLRIEVAR